MNLTIKEYLTLLIPVIVAILTVGIPGVLAYRKMKKQDRLDDTSVASQQVGISLDLVGELNTQYDKMSVRLKISEELNEQHTIRIRDLEEAERANQIVREENQTTIEKLYFEQRVSTAHSNHLIGIIHTYAKQMAEVNIIPAVVPKTRKEIEAELLLTEKQ